jgi:hypothetical protein
MHLRCETFFFIFLSLFLNAHLLFGAAMSCESRDRTCVLIDVGTFFLGKLKTRKSKKRKDKRGTKEKEKEKKSGSSITYLHES